MRQNAGPEKVTMDSHSLWPLNLSVLYFPFSETPHIVDIKLGEIWSPEQSHALGLGYKIFTVN